MTENQTPTDAAAKSNDRKKRERVLAIALELFPTESPHAYAESSARYQRWFENRRFVEIQGMFAARLVLVMRRWRRFVDEQMKRRGQSVNRWQTLFELAVNDHGETLTSIATRVDVSNPALVALFDELERDGLIERIVDENDRRSKVIVLTPAGEQEVSSLFELLTELRSEFLQGIEQNELLLMLDVITVMKNNLEKMTGQKIY